jgi:hypothetical protein
MVPFHPYVRGPCDESPPHLLSMGDPGPAVVVRHAPLPLAESTRWNARDPHQSPQAQAQTLSICWQSRTRGGVAGNGRRGTTRRVRRRTPFREANERSEAGYGRNGMRLKSGKPHWLASCSIGCGSGVVLSPMRPVEEEIQGITSPVARFVQQRRSRLAMWAMMCDSCVLERGLATGSTWPEKATAHGTADGVQGGCFPDLYAALASCPSQIFVTSAIAEMRTPDALAVAIRWPAKAINASD